MRTAKIGPDLRLGLSLPLVLSLALRGFLRVRRFLPLLKNQHFQIPLRPGMWSSKSLVIIYFIH